MVDKSHAKSSAVWVAERIGWPDLHPGPLLAKLARVVLMSVANRVAANPLWRSYGVAFTAVWKQASPTLSKSSTRSAAGSSSQNTKMVSLLKLMLVTACESLKTR